MRIACGPAGSRPFTRCTGTGSRRKGCGNMVRMEVVDAAVNEIMATTFRVPVKRLILVKGTDYQDQLDEISYRIRALDPDLMSDEQFDEQVRRLRAERDRPKALPAEPDRWDEQLTGELYSDIYQALPASERGAWLTSHGFVIHATKKQVSVIPGLPTWSEIWCDVENSKSFRSSHPRRVSRGHRLKGPGALHNYLALIFHSRWRQSRERTWQVARSETFRPAGGVRYVRSPGSRETCEGQLTSGDRGLLGDEGPAFPGRDEHLSAGWAGLAAGLLARDPRALEPAAAAGAVQRGVQRDPHPGKVIAPVPVARPDVVPGRGVPFRFR